MSGTVSGRRVVHLIDQLGTGGAERLLITAARQAQAAGWDMRVVSLSPAADTQVRRDLLDQGIHPIHVPSTRRRTLVDPVRASVLRRVIRDLEPDILHAHLRFSSILAPVACAGLAVPRVVTLHTVAGGPAERRDAMERRALAHGFHARIAVGPTVATTQGRRLGREVTVIPNPVDGQQEASATDVARERELLLAGAPGPLLLWVGRLTEAKALPDLLRAFALVRHHHPGSVLVIAGDGDLRRDLEVLAEELRIDGHVRFLGARPDVPVLMRAADVLVLSSVQEGLPLVVLEAMAAGRPVVATDVGDVSYAVGDAGLLVPPGEYCQLASAVTQLLADPHLLGALGARAAEIARTRHDASVWATRVNEVYDTVIGAGATAGAAL